MSPDPAPGARGLADQYPVNLIVAGQRCLVVGGGPVAARKAAGLLACGAVVHVIAAAAGPDVRALLAQRATVEERPLRPGDTAGFRLVIAATDDREANRVIFEEAERAGIWINSADDPASSSFTLPSVVRQGPVAVAISTGGRSPALAAWLKRRIEAELGPEYEILAGLLSEARDGLKAVGRSTEEVDWQTALDSDMLSLIRAGEIARARERLQACLSSSSG
jgi:siroheme synthase-like protein